MYHSKGFFCSFAEGVRRSGLLMYKEQLIIIICCEYSMQGRYMCVCLTLVGVASRGMVGSSP